MTRYLVYAYAFSLPLTAFSVIPWFGFQVSYAITFVLGIIIFLEVFLTRRISIPATPINRAVIIFWAASLFSVIGVMTADTYVEFQGELPMPKFFKQAFALTFMTTMYFILVAGIKNRTVLLTSIKFFILSTFLASVYGFYQLIGAFWDLPYRRILFNNPSYHLAKEEYGLMGLFRITSFSPEPSMFANSLLAVIPLISICYLNRVKILGSTKWNAFLFTVLLTAMILTFSRGGYVITMAVLVFIFLRMLNFKIFLRNFLLIVLFFIAGAAIARFSDVGIIGATKERFFSTFDINDLSIWERATLFMATISIFQSHPVFGVGIGNFGLNFFNHMPSWGYMGTERLPAANNLIGGIVAETGVVGLSAFIYLIYVILKEGIAAIRHNKEKKLWNSMSIGILLSFLAVFLHLSIGLATLSFSYFWFLIAGIAVLGAEKKMPELSVLKTRNVGIKTNLAIGEMRCE